MMNELCDSWLLHWVAHGVSKMHGAWQVMSYHKYVDFRRRDITEL